MSAAAETEANPLTQGLERLPVRPTSLVIFGATGDLAHRKLLPALYNLAADGALPERIEIIGVARRDKEDEDFQQIGRESIEKFSRRKPDDDVLKGLIDDMRYVPGTFDDDNVYSELQKTLKEFDEKAGEPLNRIFYLSTAPRVLPRHLPEAGGGRPRQVRERRDASGDREAVRLRPGLRDEAQPRGARGLRRVPGFPDRPLPGQGDRAEHAGVAVRQHAVRAGLEPQLRRQRPDHRRGGPRHRRTGRVLRRRRRPARPGAEPHAPATRSAHDGASDRVRRRPAARREAPGPRGDRST